LTAILVLGIATTSFASPGKGKGNWKLKTQGNWKVIQLTDVGSHWAEQPVRFMLAQGIISGYPDSTYRPNNPVTKFEAIMMISKASGFDGTAEQRLTWDKNVPDWMEECLDYAVDEGILTEDEADNLKGWEPAKRYEVAIWAARAMGVDVDDQASFLDNDEIPNFARPYVGGMFKHHFMVGYPGNKFQPNKPVTRAELAAVIYRIMLAETDGGGNGDSDSDSLEIERLTPADGSNNVDPATDQLTARFNVEIQAVDDLQSVEEGIIVRNVSDGEDAEIDGVNIEGRYLTINLEDSLEDDKTYRVTIDDNIIEAAQSGENFEGISGSEWEFSTGTDSDLRIVSLSPEDGDTNVDGENTTVLEAEFSGDIQVISGKNLLDAVKVYNISESEYVDIDEIEIDEDTLIITLDDPLTEGDTFEVTIKANYLEEEDSGVNFEGISGGDWRFSTSS